MKRFAFRLERLREIRGFREREAEAALGRAVSRLAEIERSMKAVAEERAKAAGERFRQGNSAQDMAVYERYIQRLDSEAERLAKDAAAAELAVEEAQAAYTEAAREKKALDTLREKRERDYRKLVNAEEVKAVDDITGGTPARRNAAG